MRRARAAGVCAGLIVAMSGAGVATAGPVHAAVPAGPVPTEVTGICGTLFGAGFGIAQLHKQIAARGAGYVGAFISAGCLYKDAQEYGRQYWSSPAGEAEWERIRTRYGPYSVADWMRETGCVEVPVGRVADDISTWGNTTWSCEGSSYGD
jgi:hypothetical protein